VDKDAGEKMKPPELVTQYRKCYSCGEETPVLQQKTMDDATVRFCSFCGQPLAEVFGHG